MRYGVYRDRPRSAVLCTLMAEERPACREANLLAGQFHASYSVWTDDSGADLPEVIHFGQRTGPRCVERWRWT